MALRQIQSETALPARIIDCYQIFHYFGAVKIFYEIK